MKSFMTVLKFEIMHYMKNKVFLVSTIILVLLASVGLSIPTIIDQFNQDEQGEQAPVDSEIAYYGLLDETGFIEDLDFMNEGFYLGAFKPYQDAEQMKEDVLDGKLMGAYVLSTPEHYEYVLVNNEMSDNGQRAFDQAYRRYYQKKGLAEAGVDYAQVQGILYPNIESDIEVLGKDSASNYMYTYILVFGLYFMIIMYGQLIATAVASEKSNRTMEILVTSTKTSYLIFGKVIGGAIAGLVQFGTIIGVARLFYSLNAAAWEGRLDMIFDIPGEILFQFSVFGILGYLLFTFIFGALGALVSKTEDINASATPVTLTFVIVFMIAVTGMQNTEGIVLRIASYIPLSSFLAMFVRVSMGTVAWYEVTISLVLLTTTTIFIGWLAAKIYRAGTLMYGNPVKIKDIPKILKH